MLLGSMLESGDLPTSNWTHDTLIALYLIAYNLVMFFFMLNFIIAIIVDACKCPSLSAGVPCLLLLSSFMHVVIRIDRFAHITPFPDAKVVEHVEDFEAEQEFFQDLCSVVVVSVKGE